MKAEIEMVPDAIALHALLGSATCAPADLRNRGLASHGRYSYSAITRRVPT